MEKWLKSVHSDGTETFVSNPSPKIGETVKIRLRLLKDSPVKHVLILSFPNGIDKFEEMSVLKTERNLVYYEAELKISEKRIPYQFYLVTEDTVYYYTQNGITTYIPDHTYDFVLISDYKKPEWVKDSVFYQIFTERFCNGNPENDVKTGEYSQNGFKTIKIENWEQVPLDYEHGHCLDFYGGDIEGIIEKIPYLKELGITALYLNPIFSAPSVHKFDCIDYYHVDPHFGGDESLEKLSTALHENGMKLVLDISINHTGIDHKWFNRDCEWFEKSVGAYNNPDSEERGYYFFGENNSYLGWFDVETMPTLNYTSESLRQKIYKAEDSVLKKWLKPPYSIDGWRFDVADIFARNNEIQLDKELWPEICSEIKSVNPNAYILAEDWGDCSEHLQGDQWDSPMNYYGCGRAIRQFLGEPDLFMRDNPILKNIPYKMTAKDFENRVTEHFSKIPFSLWENQFNLFDSHDTARLHNNPKITKESYRGAVIFQFLLPGAPSIYYGDEAEIEGT
ncbi:MAG: alpha amylase N-terminal ig-like domain-containing protein, partial [Oscillospiraceae bacterium]|nr:alpha amylase N-terminal ig-like domain-containing protein [Oscillospiraceae bacterium]